MKPLYAPPTPGVDPWIDPEMRPILDASLERNAGRPTANAISIEALRRRTRDDLARWNEDLPHGVSVDDVELASAYGRRRMRIVRPDGANDSVALIWLHGGGFVVGDADTHLRLAAELAEAGAVTVALPEYVLAPEHPFPEPIRSATELIDAALDVLGAERLLLGGDSAGAALALAAAIGRRAGDKLRPLSLTLVYGCYAPRFDTASHHHFGTSYGLTTDVMRFFWKTYLGGEPPESADLLRADLGGMPDTCLVAAGLDPLFDDTLDLAGRLTAAGVPVTVHCQPGVIHGYIHMTKAVSAARNTVQTIGGFLRKSTGTDAGE